MALQNLPAAQLLPSRASRSTFCSNFLLFDAFLADIDGFDIDRIFSLLLAILNNKFDSVIWNNVNITIIESTPPLSALSYLDQTLLSLNTSSFINTSEHRKYMNDVLKIELGSDLYIGVPRFYEVFFGEVESLETAIVAIFVKCQKSNNPLYNKKLGWRNWPQSVTKKNVLK